MLARVYAPWFERLLGVTGRAARVVEVGAGPGTLRAFAKDARPDLRWLASDLEPVPWNDLAADAGRLPIRSGCAGAVLGLDVLHHLPDPAAFFAEAARVLAPGEGSRSSSPGSARSPGRSTASCTRRTAGSTSTPGTRFPPASTPSTATPPCRWRLVRDTPEPAWRRLGFGAPRVALLNTFAYLMSLGFSPASLLPAPLSGPLLALDRWTAPLASLLALRGFLVWDRA